MTNPYRGQTGRGTYFITADCFQKKRMLQSDRSAALLIDVLYHYRGQSKYLLHEFVVMPNHFHLLITPGREATLERALQLIKGGFSFRAGRELGMHEEIWQTSFHDRRVRDAEEYRRFRDYIYENPVRAGLVPRTEDWPHSSACGNFELDEVPQRLKPLPKTSS